MKLHGQTIKGPSTEVIVFPREGGDIVLTVQAVLDFDPFFAICPRPNPPLVKRPGKADVPNFEDPKYNQKLTDWSTKNIHWTCLKSLEATAGLEWDKVKMEDPDTYELWQEELKDAFFTPREINHILQTILKVCGMSEEHLEEAKKRFLATRQAEQENSQKVEP